MRTAIFADYLNRKYSEKALPGSERQQSFDFLRSYKIKMLRRAVLNE